MKIISHPYDSLQNLGNATEEGEKKNKQKNVKSQQEVEKWNVAVFLNWSNLSWGIEESLQYPGSYQKPESSQNVEN